MPSADALNEGETKTATSGGACQITHRKDVDPHYCRGVNPCKSLLETGPEFPEWPVPCMGNEVLWLGGPHSRQLHITAAFVHSVWHDSVENHLLRRLLFEPPREREIPLELWKELVKEPSDCNSSI